MIFVVDTNVLISALIRDSVTRKIIVSSGFDFCYPSVSFAELERHKGMIIERSGLGEDNFNRVLAVLMSHVKVVPYSAYSGKIGEARAVLGGIDIDDVAFLALALSIEGSFIWSNDNHLHSQDKVKVFWTKDFLNIL